MIFFIASPHCKHIESNIVIAKLSDFYLICPYCLEKDEKIWYGKQVSRRILSTWADWLC